MLATQTTTQLNISARCAITAWATVRANPQAIAKWRKQPLTIGPEVLSTSSLKHADNQTVTALEAVRVAQEHFAGTRPDFRHWGVIAGTNFLGRERCARSILAYPTDGAWGVSPHFIPHQSIHAISGTISQALQSHGPNLGVGGGPNAVPDTFLLAASLLIDAAMPGLWLVLVGHESECIPGLGGDLAAPDCLSIALALVPTTNSAPGCELRFRDLRDDDSLHWKTEPTLDSCANAIAQRQSSVWRLGGTVVAEIDFVGHPEEG